MSDSQPTVLPLEVCGLIIDCLAEDKELTTIRTCSLACHAFLPLTRKHTFASVEINDPFAEGHPSPSIEAFVSLIRSTPEIGEYVRKLDYAVGQDDHTMFPMAYTLSKLTKLKSLGIWNNMRDKLTWRCPKWSLGPVFLHLMQLPSLTSLKLHWIEDFPIFDLIHSPSLSHLAIDHADFTADAVSPTVPLPPNSIYLHEYDVGRESSSTTKKLVEAQRPDGLPVVNFTELAKVTANCDKKQDLEAIRAIFKRANQVQNISLRITKFLTYAGLAEMVMGSIRTLKILTLASMVDNPRKDPLSRLCDELRIISSSGHSVMENLSITVEVATDADCKRGDEWGSLDKVLTQKDAWPRLKEVSLKIIVYDYDRPKEDDIMEVLGKLPVTQFKGLSASETVNFKFEVTAESDY